MGDLERLELILRRIMQRRKSEHEDGKRILDVDSQELLEEIADEIASWSRK